ncbi:MAG: hypothetical protein AB8G26_19325 [Ilumatobacter sp.]
MTPPDDLHEWISFEDPGEYRTWLFDATFLRSSYTCIFGCGCKGIADEPAPEAALGCCSFGAHFVDEADVATVEAIFDRVAPEHMQFHEEAMRGGYLTEGQPDDNGEPTAATRTIDGACIFANRPGFEGGVGCALHIAAESAGERPLDWKPQVCWQVPLRLEDFEEETGHVISRLREWKRRDWGEGGADFGWWCTEESEAFVGAEPLYRSARDEIVELIGADVYETMRALLDAPASVPLPHPAIRRPTTG